MHRRGFSSSTTYSHHDGSSISIPDKASNVLNGFEVPSQFSDRAHFG